MTINGHDVSIHFDPTAGVWEVFIDGDWVGACDSASDAREYAKKWIASNWVSGAR